MGTPGILPPLNLCSFKEIFDYLESRKDLDMVAAWQQKGRHSQNTSVVGDPSKAASMVEALRRQALEYFEESLEEEEENEEL